MEKQVSGRRSDQELGCTPSADDRGKKDRKDTWKENSMSKKRKAATGQYKLQARFQIWARATSPSAEAQGQRSEGDGSIKRSARALRGS